MVVRRMSARRTWLLAVLAGFAVTAVTAAAPAGEGASTTSAAIGETRPCNVSTATRIPQPTAAHLAAAGLSRLPVAPVRKRVDLVAARFSNSTRVTNPLFPISKLQSAILNGRVSSEAFRVETTLLPDTRIIEWSAGQCVKTLVSQYVAYLGGRIEEVALDFYAQADDGSVWYFGEDVYNYEHGVIADTSGTWLAGKEGPAAMIMPAAPRAGDVNRPENIPGLVFEEVAVKKVGKTVAGPRGPVQGAMVGRELHDDGSFSHKTFATGYGEVFTAHEGDVEALALAVPTDALGGPPPAELRTVLAGSNSIFDAAAARRWRMASTDLEKITTAWNAHRARGMPPRLIGPAHRALNDLTRAIRARSARRTRHAALDLAQATLDLQLSYRPPAEIDLARFELWTRRVLIDASARDLPAVRGDVATLEWIRDRVVVRLDSIAVTRIDAHLEELRADVADRKLSALAKTARELLKIV
jgi:hypothetical protein